MPDHEVYGLLGWYVALMLTPPENLANKTISIIEESEIFTYDRGAVDKETITEFDKDVFAYRVRLQSREKEDDAYLIRLSPEYNRLPVNMKRFKFKMSVSVTIKKLEWIE